MGKQMVLPKYVGFLSKKRECCTTLVAVVYQINLAFIRNVSQFSYIRWTKMSLRPQGLKNPRMLRRLYRSTNGGETWNDITDFFKGRGFFISDIIWFIKHHVSKMLVIHGDFGNLLISDILELWAF